MKNENESIQDNYLSETQKKLNSTISSDTIKILSLLKSYPSTAASSSFLLDNKQLLNSFNTNNNNLENNNCNYDNLSYEEIKAICLKIFMYYAKPIKGQFYLNQRYIFQILKEMEIINENCLSYVDVEILIQQINKKGDKLNSEQFLDLLAKICCLLDDTFYKDKKASFIKLIKVYIGPYLQKKNRNEIENTNINNEDINLNLNFKDLILNEYKLDKDSFGILMSIIEGLKIIYISYFSLSEISLNKDLIKVHKDSFNTFIKFLKDFEIIPYLIKQRLAELYWSIIISIDINELYLIEPNNENENIFKSFLNNNKYNLGKIYTFKKFFLLFSHISFYYYNSIKSKTKGQKLLYFIEKIYKSKGYQSMPNLYNKTFSKRYSIIPPLTVVEKVNNNKIEHNNKIKNKNNLDNNKEILKDLIELDNENYKILENFIEPLKTIFDIYCHIYDRHQNGIMHFSNYQKMLLDGELINIKIKDKDNQDINNEIERENSPDIKLNYDNNKNCLKNKSKNKNKKASRPKLQLLDLDVIISQVCSNAYLSEKNKKLHNDNYDSFNYNQSYESNNISENYYSNKVNKSYSIDFILFLKTLPLIALKMYPNDKKDINISMKHFLTNEMDDFISNLNQKSINFSQNNEFNILFKVISTNEDLNQLINDISPLLKSYFEYYTEKKGKKEKLMNYNLFFHFFKDYEIYPLWINLSNLSEIFFSQVSRQNKEKNTYLNISEKINFPQFLECFVAIGLTMESGDDFDMIDKVLFLIDKMFSENYGKVIKKIKNLQSFKEDYFYYEKILRDKYPSYYERKYSNCNHRYDNKFYWVYEKNYGGDKNAQQIDFGELFNKEKVKFSDVFDEINNTDLKNQTYKSNEPINEIKEE